MKNLSIKKIVAAFLTFTLVMTYVPAIDVYANNQNITEGAFKLNALGIAESTSAGRADISLDWEDYNFNVNGDSVSTDYFVARRPVYYQDNSSTIKSYGNWEIRGKYGKRVNVLNIYPDKTESAGLKNWMATQSEKENVDIVVTTQSLTDFNNNPYKYLKKSTDGSYNFDVIVFGFWDSNNKVKITTNATNIVQDFIDAGYGVVFGHDTIQHSTINLGFNNLVQNNLDLIITKSDKSRWFYSEKISVRKQGSITTYPFEINGQNLKIPMSHSVGQLPGNTVTGVPNNDEIYMTFEPNYYPNANDGPYFNYNVNGGAKGPSPMVSYKHNSNPTYNYVGSAYLVKTNNVAFIQCGHSSGSTSNAEQMLLANLIYSIAQIVHGESTASDQVLDDVAPTNPSLNPDFTFASEDSGVGFEYRIIAFPQGYKLSNVDKNGLQTALSSNVTKYNDSVVFSNSYTTGELISKLKGSTGYESEVDLASYRYYVDKNSVGARIPPVEVDSIEDTTDDFYSLKINEKFDYTKHFGKIGDITEDDWLHIVAYDRANNASTITDIRVLDAIQKVDAYTKFVDKSGNPISPGTDNGDADGNGTVEYLSLNNPNQYVGSTFSVNSVPNFNFNGVDYVYSHSVNAQGEIINPTAITLTDDATKNVITEVYDKQLTKKVWLVDDRTALSGAKTPYDYTSVTLKEGEILDINDIRPDLTKAHYTYEGWSNATGVGTIDNSITGNSEYTMSDDSKDIYIYYKKNTAEVNVTVSRDNDGVDGGETTKMGTFNVKGFVGETLTVTGSDIRVQVKPTLLNCYSNSEVLINYNKDFILENESTLTDTITLIPRTKNILYFGVDFREIPSGMSSQTTSSSAISVLGDKSIVVPKIFETFTTFNPTVNTLGFGTHTAPATFTYNSETWKNYLTDGAEDQNLPVNFGNNSKVYAGYYIGDPLNERYTVKTKYVNVIDNSELFAPTTSPVLNVTDTSIKESDVVDIYDIKDLERNIAGNYIAPSQRAVDFEIDYYRVLFGTKVLAGNIKTLEEINQYIPTEGIGEYTLEVYYRPYSQIKCVRNIYGYDRTTVVSTQQAIYNQLYSNKTHSISVKPTDEYSVEVVGGDYADGKISSLVDAYDKTITANYKPLVYDLVVNVINDSGSVKTRDYTAYTFKNVPAKSVTSFKIPVVDGFGFIKYNALAGTDDSYIKNVDGKINFDPDEKEISSKTAYSMELHYGQKASLNLTYVAFTKDGRVTKSMPTNTTHYVGETVTVNIPEVENLDLQLAYLDGSKYFDVNADQSYDLKVTKPSHQLYLIYTEKKYTLTVENASGDDTGYVVGGGEYYKGETAIISAIPANGYKFVGWTISPNSASVPNLTATGEQSLVMPMENVVARASFVETSVIDPVDPDTDPDTTNPEVVKPEPPTVPVVPEKPTFPEKPEPPIKPEKPSIGDIEDLVNDPYYKIIREYSVYVHGYPDANIHPSDSITRAEVMAVIYNLYGNGYVSDEKSLEKFSDADSGNWYSQAISFCADFGVVNGYADSTIRPNEPISRAELAAIIAKFVVAKNEINQAPTFSDVKAGWVKSSIDTLYKNGIVAGYQDGTFKPNAETKRSEFVVMVNRLIKRPEEYKEEKTFPDLPKTHWAYADMMNASNGAVIGEELPEYILENIKK